MHEQTFKTINTLTAGYVDSLKNLRDSLKSQLADVEAQIKRCEEFGDMRMAPPGPTISGGTIRVSGGPIPPVPAANLGKAEYSDDGRPRVPSRLSDEDAKRLAHALEQN